MLDNATFTALQTANIQVGDTVSLKIQVSTDNVTYED